MSSLIDSPCFWITAQLLVLMVVGYVLGWWHIQIHPDSQSYIDVSGMALRQALSQTRTLGYTMILRLVAVISADYSAIPWLQVGMLWPAVFMLYFAMRRFGALKWQAYIVSSGFMCGAIQQVWTVSSLLTDFPATVFAGMAIACLLMVAANTHDLWAWIGLTFFITLAYHIRPAYLFLIPLVPVLGIILARICAIKRGILFAWKKKILLLMAISFLPFVLFCFLRWALVGDFALVAFGGTQTVGLAAELLNTKMVENELSKSFQPFAREILKGRQERGLKAAFPEGWLVDMRAYEDNYSPNIYFIALPSAKRLFGEEVIIRNRKMADFSREVMGLQKRKCLMWAIQYWPRALLKVMYRYWILQISIPLLSLLFIIHRFKWYQSIQSCPEKMQLNNPDKSVLSALLWINALYFGSAVSVLILSGTYADSRLIVPTAVFLPSLVGLLILQELQSICNLKKILNKEVI
ncbi:MAG: hypothetical protein WCP12_11110 [bacterium]